MKCKKLTTTSFLSALTSNINEQNDLLAQPIPPYLKSDVFQKKIGKRTLFKLSSAKSNLQESLNRNFLSKIEVNHSAIAYIPNKCYLDMFEPHVKNTNFLRLDIKSFFHSINRSILRDTFKSYISDDIFFKGDEDNQTLLDAFLNLICLDIGEDFIDDKLKGKSILPIGFKSSPMVSNIVFRKSDFLIQKLCANNEITYTRYADDMLFSSPKGCNFVHTERFLSEISYLLSLSGFEINKKKTIKDKNMISINGYVIDCTGCNSAHGYIRISEKKTKLIYKLIFMVENGVSYKEIMNRLFNVRDSSVSLYYKKGKGEFMNKFYASQVLNRLTGYRSYLISIIIYNNKYGCIRDRDINTYQSMIDKLEKMIYKVVV